MELSAEARDRVEFEPGDAKNIEALKDVLPHLHSLKVMQDALEDQKRSLPEPEWQKAALSAWARFWGESARASRERTRRWNECAEASREKMFRSCLARLNEVLMLQLQYATLLGEVPPAQRSLIELYEQAIMLDFVRETGIDQAFGQKPGQATPLVAYQITKEELTELSKQAR